MASSSSIPGAGTRASTAGNVDVALEEFVRAEAERVRTIEAYNAELKHQRDRGIFPPKLDAEYRTMEDAREVFWKAQKHLLKIAAAPVSLSGGEEKGQGDPFGTGYSSETTPSGRGASREYPSRTAAGRDRCEFCWGTKGGVPGNENRLAGVIVCDYCTVLAQKASIAFGCVQALGTEARSAETFGLGPKDDGPATTSVATQEYFYQQNEITGVLASEPLPLLSEQKHGEGRE